MFKDSQRLAHRKNGSMSDIECLVIPGLHYHFETADGIYEAAKGVREVRLKDFSVGTDASRLVDSVRMRED